MTDDRADLFQGHHKVGHPGGASAEGWQRIRCGHCGRAIAAAVVARINNNEGHTVLWLQCPGCGKGSVANPDGTISPGAPFGPNVEGLPAGVSEAYEEARRSMAVGAFRGAELLCRNILMNIAVQKGADVGLSFVAYVGYLSEANYVTPPMRGWVDQIRKHGNDAGHEIEAVPPKRAEATMWFTATLLTLIYETEHRYSRFALSDDEEGST